MEQTYIIKTNGGGKRDFYRLGVKKASTAIKYLVGWYNQAKEKDMYYLYRDLLSLDSTYKLIETPDGYNEGSVIASGLIVELVDRYNYATNKQ